MSTGKLSECIISTNCILAEWEFENINNKFIELIDIASSLPRVEVIEYKNNYWHGICRSLIFRFPDDLEILKLNPSLARNKKGLIQVKSASRLGLSDIGVNKKRVGYLYKKLTDIDKKNALTKGHSVD